LDSTRKYACRSSLHAASIARTLPVQVWISLRAWQQLRGATQAADKGGVLQCAVDGDGVALPSCRGAGHYKELEQVIHHSANSARD